MTGRLAGSLVGRPGIKDEGTPSVDDGLRDELPVTSPADADDIRVEDAVLGTCLKLEVWLAFQHWTLERSYLLDSHSDQR